MKVPYLEMRISITTRVRKHSCLHHIILTILTRRKIKSLNPNLNVLSSAFDIRDSEAFASFRDLVKESFNGLNYLFNNAGFTIIDSAVSDNINEMRKVMDVNYWGVVQGSLSTEPSNVSVSCMAVEIHFVK